jgi:hypothetical protein
VDNYLFDGVSADLVRYLVLAEFLIAFGFLLGLMVHRPSKFPKAFLYGFGSSYVLLIGLGCAEIQLRLGQPASWHTVLALLAGTVAAVTMAFVYRER